jgi:N-acetylglucosamine kinase-like BadF-type ATPase
MKTLIKLFLVAIVVLVVAVWYYSDKNTNAEHAKTDLKNFATDAKDFAAEKLHLSSDDIKSEFAKTGKVVREKAAAAISSPDITDAKITTAVKAKLAADSALSVLNISVSTTDGVVTLSGTGSSPANIAKSIQIAMETDGVKKVVSTLTVKE